MALGVPTLLLSTGGQSAVQPVVTVPMAMEIMQTVMPTASVTAAVTP